MTYQCCQCFDYAKCTCISISTVFNDSVNGQRSPRSDCAPAQSDLGLPCPHIPRNHLSARGRSGTFGHMRNALIKIVMRINTFWLWPFLIHSTVLVIQYMRSEWSDQTAQSVQKRSDLSILCPPIPRRHLLANAGWVIYSSVIGNSLCKFFLKEYLFLSCFPFLSLSNCFLKMYNKILLAIRPCFWKMFLKIKTGNRIIKCRSKWHMYCFIIPWFIYHVTCVTTC